MLAAEAEQIGSCLLCNIDKEAIRKILNIPSMLHVDSVIALGYKAEHPVLEEREDTVKYWRDKNDVLHVPKRHLETILHINKFT
jgi:nitroreductase